jgi:hypothetical protein
MQRFFLKKVFSQLHSSRMSEASSMRVNISNMFRDGNMNKGNCKFGRIFNSLKWRQRYQNSTDYIVEFDDQRILKIRQVQNGEMKGMGTGTMVWPAAHIMVKYLERMHQSTGLRGMRVLDIGSGTGIAGLVAAMLGANVVLTDQQQLIPLLELNTLDAVKSGVVGEHLVTVKRYDWGANASELFAESMPFDLLLVSDCVLPKLYPIDLLLSVRMVPSMYKLKIPAKLFDLYPGSGCSYGVQYCGFVFLRAPSLRRLRSSTGVVPRFRALIN